jgi:hypothetical protein
MIDDRVLSENGRVLGRAQTHCHQCSLSLREVKLTETGIREKMLVPILWMNRSLAIKKSLSMRMPSFDSKDSLDRAAINQLHPFWKPQQRER